ncbi:MAG: UPF0149 family protein [Sphingomonas bacterium]
MERLSTRVRKLDKALGDLPPDSEVMLLSQLDGLIAGVLVCPELILPGDWLSLVWGEGDDAFVFDDRDQARRLTGMVMEHYNAVAATLSPGGRHEALFDVDTRHDETIWEIWIEGFEAAMELRPDSWLEIARSADKEAAAALAGMIALAGIARHESGLSDEVVDQLTLDAPALIPMWVGDLNDWRLANASLSAPNAPTPIRKVGRNDPCPCGSGRKYKKCCLN